MLYPGLRHLPLAQSWVWLGRAVKDLSRQLEVVAGDSRDRHGIAEAIKVVAIVLHIAVLMAFPFSYHAPDAYVQANMNGTLNVLEAARRMGTS